MARTVPLQRTGRLVALVAVLALGAACTGNAAGSTGPAAPGGTSATSSTGPTETVSAPAGSAVYTYANQGLLVTVTLEASEGTMEVDNGTDHDLGPPDVYVREAHDGHRVEGEVVEAAPVPAGTRATFDVILEQGITPQDIGLLVLLFGPDNYGAFVRRA